MEDQNPFTDVDGDIPREDDIESARRAARDRQRLNAAKLAALQGVADAVARVGREAGASVDGLSLVTAFLDYLSEGMLGRDGMKEDDCRSFLTDLTRRQCPSATNPVLLHDMATTVMHGLGNEPGNWRPFRVEFWSEERRNFATSEFRFLDFRTDGGKERWALTDEGARLTLFNLDATSDDAELQDILMRRAIERGRVDEIGRQAEQYARSARVTYIAIADNLSRTRRGKGLGWDEGVGAAIDEGRALIAKSGDGIREMRRLIAERAADDDLALPRREALQRIVADLQAVLDAFSLLSARIMVSYDEFGLILVSTPTGLPDDLPDYGDEILTGFLRMPAQEGLAALDELAAMILPASVPPVADIAMLLDEALEDVWLVDESPEGPVPQVDETADEPPVRAVLDGAVMRQAAVAFVEAVRLSGHGGILLSEMARKAAGSTAGEGAAACLVISAFTCSRADIEVTRYDGTFRVPGLFAGDDLLFKWRTP